MRLSEKTVELNICSQINQYMGGNILWFGLTQRQEAHAGFDAATRVRGRIILFQFKASDRTLVKSGARQFQLEHDQLQNLIHRVQRIRREVFYVFPMIGTTQELRSVNGNFIDNTWLLDVGRLPTRFPLPTIRGSSGRLRVNRMHYADVLVHRGNGSVVIHSDPVSERLYNLGKLAREKFRTQYFQGGPVGFIDDRRSSKEFLHRVESILNPGLKMAIIH